MNVSAAPLQYRKLPVKREQSNSVLILKSSLINLHFTIFTFHHFDVALDIWDRLCELRILNTHVCQDMKGNVRVFCRFRPLTKREEDLGDIPVLHKVD